MLLLTVMTIGALGLGVFVHERVEADLMEGSDDELNRALLSRFGDRPRPGEGPAPDGLGPGPENQAPDDAIDNPGNPQEVVLNADGSLFEVSADGNELASRDLSFAVGKASIWTLDGDPPFRIATSVRPDGRTNVVGIALVEVAESMASLRRALWLGLAALIALQLLVVSLVVRAVNRPIARLTNSANRIANGDLDTTIQVDGGPKEAAELAGDLQLLMGQLRHTIADSERSAQTAEQAREDMKRFMADASHELRTPLTAIKGFSDLYERGMLDEGGIDNAMDRIGVESERLSKLANDLLHLLRPTDSQHLEQVDMAAVMSAVVQDLRAAYPSAVLALDLRSNEAPNVFGDAQRLHQAILNLGANACQHTPEGTEIRFEVRVVGGRVECRVVDNGPGFEPEMVSSLFAPFVRADQSRSRHDHDGAGLGLTIAQNIAHHHNGGIELTQTPGGGATATLSLPQSDE